MTFGNILDCLSVLKNVKTAHLYRQAAATFASSLLSLAGGLTFGYTAVLLSQLEKDETFEYNKDYDSWIASIAPLAMTMGCLFSGTVSDALGRRKGQFFLVIPYSLAWVIMGLAKNNTVMLIGRFLTGICTGAVRPLTIVYIGELTTPKYRSITLFVPSMAIHVGSFISHTVGKYVYWRTSCYLFIIPNIICVLTLLFLKESPLWLITNGKVDEGVESFKFFRGVDEDSQKELDSVLEKNKNKEDQSSFRESVALVFSRPFFKSLNIIFWIFVAVQWCGINNLSFYAQDIYEKTFSGKIDSFMLMLVTDGIRVIASIFVCIFAQRLPRKLSFLISCYGTIIVLVLLVIDLYLSPESLVGFAVALMIIYLAISSLISCTSWAFIAEIFPSKVRGFGSGLSSAISFVLLFSSVQTTPSIMSAYGPAAMYAIFAGITLLATIFLQFILPETNGRTLQDIENTMFKDKKDKSINKVTSERNQIQAEQSV